MVTVTEEAPPTAVPQRRPLGWGGQALVLMGAFVGGPAAGWAVGHIPGDLSETARTLLYVPFVLVFFLGYAAWVARLKAIVFESLGWPLLKALFRLVVRRQRPRSVEDVLSRERLAGMAERALAAGGAFRHVGWLVGIAAGLVAALLDSAWAPASRFVLVSSSCIAWGYALALLARRGWLPIPEQA